MTDRVLSQAEIDSVFRNLKSHAGHDSGTRHVQPYDFRHPDRIAKEQLRSIHLLHEHFARNLRSSLSAYLRASVVVNLVSVEQLSFMEFMQCLPSPTYMVSLGMSQFENNALLEISPATVFPILEMLLGGSGNSNLKIEREVTEIEQLVLDGVVRVILRDLRDAWRQVAAQIDFTIEAYETEPQLLQILAPNEAVVALSFEVGVGGVTGMMNLALPSITIKMLGQKLDQQWTSRKAESTESGQAQILHLIRNAMVHVDSRLRGPTLSVDNLLKLSNGHVLTFDYPVDRPIDVMLNGKLVFKGQVVAAGCKRSVKLVESISAQR